MKKLIFSLLAASALFVSFAFGKSAKNEEIEEPEKTSNLIKNGDFSKGKKFWEMFLSNGSADQLVTENGEMEIQIKKFLIHIKNLLDIILLLLIQVIKFRKTVQI